MPRRRETRRIRVERSDYLRPFAEAAHIVATNLFGPDYTKFIKEKSISEILWHLILHMYNEDHRKKTNLRIPVDVEMVNILKGNRKLGFFAPETTYDVYTRDKETGRFTTAHSGRIQPTSLSYGGQFYPLQRFFRLLGEYHRNKSQVDEDLVSKLRTLEEYARAIDALLPYPEDYPTTGDLPRPLLYKLLEDLSSLHPRELFTLENYDKITKPWIEKIFTNGKTRAAHTILATLLGIIMGLDDSDLQAISRRSNHFDHLYRANLLDKAKELAKSIRSKIEGDTSKSAISDTILATILPYPELARQLREKGGTEDLVGTFAIALAYLIGQGDARLPAYVSSVRLKNLSVFTKILSRHIPEDKTPEEIFEELKKKYGEERLTFEIDLDSDEVKTLDQSSEPLWWIKRFLYEKGGYSSTDKEMLIYNKASQFIRRICGSDPDCQRRAILVLLDMAKRHRERERSKKTS